MNNQLYRPTRLQTFFIYCIPLIIISSLLLTYFISKDFYLNYILSGLNRESQAVENFTFFPILLASFVLFINSWRLKNIQEYRLSFVFIFLMGLAAFFFAGEESSWGQSYFFWLTPDILYGKTVETNLHNSFIPINSLGNLFLIIVFVIIPLLWKYNKLPKSLAAAIPEGPVISCIVFAFSWKLLKVFFRFFLTKNQLDFSPFYVGFVEQINEQKEMLIAIGFFIYAFYKDAVVKEIIKKKNNK